MGVEWGDDAIVLKPFLETATYRNVLATGAAVVNLTDDVRVFARAAISNPTYPTVPGDRRPRRRAGRLLLVARAARCDRSTARRRARASRPPSCIAARAASSSASTARATPCSRRRSTRRGCTCCRATFIESEMARLQVIVDKTAGPHELEAMALLADYVRAAPAPDRRRERERCRLRRGARRACTSACSICAARSDAGSAASARRRRRRRCCVSASPRRRA